MGCCGSGYHRDGGYGHHDSFGDHGHEYETNKPRVQRATSPTPMDLLKERLAKGEITMTEYQEIIQTLSS